MSVSTLFQLDQGGKIFDKQAEAKKVYQSAVRIATEVFQKADRRKKAYNLDRYFECIFHMNCWNFQIDKTYKFSDLDNIINGLENICQELKEILAEVSVK